MFVDHGELDVRPASKRYDRDAAFDAYCRLLDSEEIPPELMDECLRYAKRFGVMMINKLCVHYTIETREEILFTFLNGMWGAFRRKVIARKVGSLHGYMRSVILNARRRTARHFWGRDLQKIGKEEYIRKYFARMPDDRTMEAEVFIEELPGALMKRALRHSRYTNPKTRGGIQYIINRLVKKERVVPTWLRDEYGIARDRVGYFMEHAVILLRMEMYWMRTHEVSFRSNEEKRRVLDVGFEPCVTYDAHALS